jgi:uncharacterized protein YceK
MRKIFIVFMILLLVGCGKAELTETERKAKYDEMEVAMKKLYEDHFNRNKDYYLQVQKIEFPFSVTLERLKTLNYDVSVFKNVDTGKSCDLKQSYAIIRPVSEDKPTEYTIDVHYKCDDYTSQNYQPFNPTENK